LICRKVGALKNNLTFPSEIIFGAITGKTRKKSPVFRNKKRKNRVWSEQKVS